MSDLIENLVDQVATAILNETPANYVTQTIAQAYRNAEIALAIIEPATRADEREKIAAFLDIRGVLCRDCNAALGHRVDSQRARGLADYLDHHADTH